MENSLYAKHVASHINDVLLNDVPSSMYPLLHSWIAGVAEDVDDCIQLALNIKNKFRIEANIPRTRPNSYLDASPEYRLTAFLMNVGSSEPIEFFTILDYLLQSNASFRYAANGLAYILESAGHMYEVRRTEKGVPYIAERLNAADSELVEQIITQENTYSSEFNDAFIKLYGASPDYTGSALESFQSLESCLKKFIGSDKGNNLGAILSWLRSNRGKWSYVSASSGQTNAEECFLAEVDFVNQSFRKIKHGQEDEKLTITKEHAEVVFRTTGLLLRQLESTIKLI